jgi:methylamine dehydrogenase accessory protein MauD
MIAAPPVIGILGIGLGTAGIVAGIAVLIAILTFLVWFVLQLFEQNGRLLTRVRELESEVKGDSDPERPPIGAREDGFGLDAPSFELPDLSGKSVSLSGLLGTGRPLLLVFTAPDCGPASTLLAKVGRWQREEAALTVVVVTTGDPEEVRRRAEQLELGRVLLAPDSELAEAYEVSEVPAAVLVSPGGLLASAAVAGAGPIERLVDYVRRHSAGESSNSPGTDLLERERLGVELPQVTLAALEGEPVDLSMLESRSVLLFWDPRCAFCRDMLPSLLAAEADRPAESPPVIVVARGDEAENRSQGLASRLLLDPTSAVAGTLGIAGTPMAVVVERRRVASAVAAGAERVLALLQAA